MPQLTLVPSLPAPSQSFPWMWPFTGAFGGDAKAGKSRALAMPLSGNVDQIIVSGPRPLTPADGQAYLEGLPRTFRNPYCRAVFFPD